MSGVFLGNLALRKGLITPDELREILAEQAREAKGGDKPQNLSLRLLAKGYVTENELRSLLQEQGSPRSATAAEIAAAGSANTSLTPEIATFGKYKVLRELGRGSWGAVYEAVDTTLDRKVALKLLVTHPASDARRAGEDEERFVREAKLAASLPKHPHVVGIYEAGVLEGKRYIAMELVQGLRLSVWRDMGASLWRAVALLKDVALAVDHAHEHGVLHRDLKPSNILVDPKNEPHVTDFGLAKSLSGKNTELTSSQFVVGTPAYIAPEQADRSKPVDRRADVYSLGVMLYEFLTGHPPFEGSPLEVLVKATSQPVQPPASSVRKGGPLTIDKTIEKICLKALSRDPEDRYATARDFAADLAKWLGGQPVAGRPSKKVAAWIAAAALAALAAAALWHLPPPRPKLDGRSVSAVLGPDRREEGLRLSGGGGRVEETVFEGNPCAKVSPDATGWASLLFDVDDAWADAPGPVELRVVYLDVPSGPHLRILYDSTDPRFPSEGAEKWAGTIWPSGTNLWKMARVPLTNPRFGNRMAGGSDLKIAVQGAELFVHRVTLERTAAPEPSPQARGLKAAQVDPASLRPGWAGEYFRGERFQKSEARRVDPDVFFDWQEGTWEAGPIDHFSVRWTGFVRVPRGGRYYFEVIADDGVRFSVDGVPLVTQWMGRSLTTDVAACELDEGFHRVTLEYLEEYGVATVIFSCLREEAGRWVPLGRDSLFHHP